MELRFSVFYLNHDELEICVYRQFWHNTHVTSCCRRIVSVCLTIFSFPHLWMHALVTCVLRQNCLQASYRVVAMLTPDFLWHVEAIQKSVFKQRLWKSFDHIDKSSVDEGANEQCEIPTGIYLLKVNNRNTRKKCKTFSKLTIKAPQRLHWCLSDVFIVNFEHSSHIFLVFLLLTLNM